MRTATEHPMPLYYAIAAAVLASGALVWATSGELVAAASFLGGVGILIAAGAVFARTQPTGLRDELASPDWSVTVAAIERPGEAVAIVDRANRLVCANAIYVDWFGASNAPPNLPLDRSALEAYAGGTGTPEIGGLNVPQALEIVRGCRGLNLVGCDLVEVSPAYDTSGNTALLGANLLFEMLCVLPGVQYR